MSSEKKQVQHLDLALRIPPETDELFKQWLIDFEEGHDYVQVSPKLRGQTLKINSQDLIDFLGFIQPDEINAFHLRQFRKQVEDQLKAMLSKSLHPDYRYHYQWCLAALNNFDDGRFHQEA